MGFYRDNNNHHIALFGFIVGAVYAAAIVLSLMLCVTFYEPAQFATFRYIGLLGMIGGFIVFSDTRRFEINNDAWAIHGIGSIFKSWLTVYFFIVLLVYLSKTGEDYSRIVMASWLVVTPFALVLASILTRYWALRLYNSKEQRRTAVFVGFSEDAQQLAGSFKSARILGIKPVGFFDNRQGVQRIGDTLPRLGALSDASEWLRKNPVDVVFIGLVHVRAADILPIIDSLHDSVASFYFVPESKLFGLGHIQYEEFAGVPVLCAYETPFIGLARIFKRLFDVVLAAMILILLSPLMLLISIGVKLSSPGPVIFKQKRYGVGGQEIVVSKFRSMRSDLPPETGEVKQATVGDVRVTPLGRILRKTSLDELPQFLNVLEGSMSIVGPRPHAVQHNELYRRQVKGYMLRHKVKPGITGWAQINGFRGETDTLEKMQKRIECDLYYMRHWSLSLDLKIILKTVLVVFKDQNAY
ncbi:undecaprenyl-phosphate glucose phosphotransferase [Herbaspirillum chlorophenolicum]|uniref:undecaprenyl-phosphate glucose phosphotransferase n=1 Tax=Herbaspirillum chlorophenolicum TaxID=211589 RepID=UPI00067B2DD0|nr:undecaprenyl-phosphate glucose phosphotransferase [Herbaspirillum chlorophenolicum]